MLLAPPPGPIRLTLPTAPPVPPIRHRLIRTAAMPDDEDDSRCARYEAECAMRQDAETKDGCDLPEGPIEPGGCRW